MLYKFDIKFAPLWHGSCREMGLNSASHNHNDSTMENPRSSWGCLYACHEISSECILNC